MNIDNFPGCCGSRVISGFGFTNTAAYGDETLESIEKFLNDCHFSDKIRSYVAIINSDQKTAGVGKILYKFGFKMRSKFYHAGHGKWCFYYILNPKVPEGKELPI